MSLLLKIQNKIINNNKLFNANKNFNNNNNKNLVINKKYINNNNKIIEKNKRNKSRINSHSFHSSNSLENSNKISELSEDSFCNGNINYRHLKGLHIDKFNFQSPIINKINNFMSHKKEKNDNNNNLKNIGSMTNLGILSPIKSEKSNSNNMSPKSSNYNKLDNQNNDNIFNYISDTNCLSDDDIKTNNNEHPFPINKNFLQNRYPLPKKESKPDYEEIHSIINENNNNNENNKIINYLLNLQPFSSKLYKTLVNFKDIFELFIKNVSQNYHSEIFDNNNIIFKYGDEADKFYIIHHGKVDLLFPFIDNIEMSIDEYFIYLMKLRIYDEFEIINEVLLINQGVFMEDSNENENFSFDDWIITAFNTLLKIKFDPSFLNKDVKTKKKKNNNSKNNNKSSNSNNKNNNSSSKKNSNNNSIISSNKSNNRNSNLNSIYPSFKNSSMKNSNNNSFNNTSSKNKNEKKNKISLLNEEGFNDDEYKTFQSKEIKELILRIENELKLTIKVCFPHLYKEIVIDKFNNYKKVIVKMKVADLSKIKIFNNTQEFIDRINPNFLFKEHNKNVLRKKIFVIKYLFLRTLKKGDFFGEILPEKLNFFSSELLKYFKKSQFNLKLHQFTHFRTMTAIAVKEEDEFINNNNNKNYNNNEIYIGSITKKLYFETLKKFSEKLSNEKYDFLLNNKLFVNTRNQNLIKTYSKCFQLKIIKEGEYLISQNKKLNPENTNIYFIKKGEFQSKCKKNIIQIDEVLTTLGYGEKIEETFPSKLKSLIDTPFYDNIIKKYFNLKLNYIGKGEIVGICEKFNENYFFNDVVCCSKEAIVYEVNSKIVNFLIESEEVIIENKNKILFGKYKVLCDMLLKQRKIFFECFFHMQNDILNDKKTKNNNSNVNNSNNNNSCLNVDNENNNNSIINTNNNNRLNLKKKILLLEKKNINNKSFYHHKSKNFSSDFLFYKNNNNSKYNNNSKNNSSINKEIIYKDLGDLDIVLSKVSSSYTFADIREKKKMEFKKKYEKLQEQKKLILLKKNNEINNNNKNNNKSISLNYNEFKKYFLLSSQLRKILPEIKINKNIDENTKVIIDYNNNNNNDNNNESNIILNNINNINFNNKISNENNNLNKINLLIYDNFNRTYNTTKYFNSYFKNNSLKIQRKNSPPEFSINLKNNIKNNIKKNHNFIKSKTDRNNNKFQTDKNKNNDIVTNRLRRIYCSKFEKELYHEYKMNKYF